MKKILIGLLVAALAFFIILVVSTQKKAERLLQKTQIQIQNRAIPLHVFSEKKRDSDEGQLLLSSHAIHDIEYSDPNYFVATSGGIYLLDANFQVADHLTTLSGLQAADVRQIIQNSEYLYFIYKDGSFSRFADNTYLHFQASGLAIRSGLVLKNQVFLADQDHVYQLQDNRLQEIIEHKHIKRIFGLEHLHIIDAENRIFRITDESHIVHTPDLQLVSGAREAEDYLWIASSRGIYSSRTKAFLFPGYYIKDCEWQNGNIFALTADGEVLNGRETIKIAPSPARMHKLKKTNGRLFALSSEGIFIRENENWRGLTIPSALPEAFITTLCQSNHGLWAGTLDQGILSIHGRTVHAHLEKSAEINDSLVLNGNPCFASTLGVLTVSVGKANRIPGTENMYCNALLTDRSELYAGSTRGLLRIRTSGLELYNLFQKLSNHKIFCLEKSDSGIWCGTMGGLQYFNGREFSKNLSSLNTSIRDNWISNIKDINGTIYFCTYNGELGEIGANDINIISRPECKFNFNNMASYKQYLFLGTFDRGIFIINLETKQSAFYRKNLPSTNINDLIVNEQQLIVASDSGIYFTALIPLLNGLNI